jgi:CubicO group peptidase (beta-lactamase class C family)
MPLQFTRRRVIQGSLAGLALVASRGRAAEELQINATLAERHKLAAEYSAGRRGVSLLVMVAGEVVFEDYPNGGGADRAHELASGTKSFNGPLVAAAIEDKLIASWDERVADTITEWKVDERRGKITLRQLLSLTSGIAGGGIARPPAYSEAIATEAEADAGERFQYGPAPFQIFGELLRRKLKTKNEGVLEYLERRIFDPIGLAHGVWRKDKDGNPHLPSGASLTAREWAKFGELIRHSGKWKEKQLVPQKELDACFTGSKANPAYGLTWWLKRPVDEATLQRIALLRRATDLVGAKTALPGDLVFAAGAGDQRMYVSRQHKLVIVRQATGILEALLGGRRQDFSDTELLSRLLLGTDAGGKGIG